MLQNQDKCHLYGLFLPDAGFLNSILDSRLFFIQHGAFYERNVVKILS